MGEIFKLFGTIGLNDKEANDGIDRTTKNAEKSSKSIGDYFKKAAVVIGTVFAVDKVISFGKFTVEAAASAEAIQAQFEQVFGELGTSAQSSIESLGKEFGMLPNRLKEPFTRTTSMFKGLGMSTEDAMNQAKTAVTAAADAAAFYDVSYEDANASLTSFIKGNYEGGEAIGLFANDTQMATYAVKQGVVSTTKEWARLDEATKQATRLEYAKNMQEQAGAAGQAARESEGYENVMGNLKQAWQDFAVIVGGPILQPVIAGMQTLTGWLATGGEKLQSFSKWMKENEESMKLVGIALGTITALLVAYDLQQGTSSLLLKGWNIVAGIGKTVTTALGAAFTFLTSPIGLVILAIGAIIAVGYLLVKNWDWIVAMATEVWGGIKKTVSDVWNAIAQTTKNVWDGIVGFLKGLWDGIVLVFKTALDLIVMLVKLWLDIVTLPIRFVWENTKQYLFAIWDAISTKISEVFTAISAFISAVLTTISTTFQNIFNPIRDFVVTTFTSIKEGITSIFTSIVEWFVQKGEEFKQFASSIFEGIRNNVVAPIQNAYNQVIGFFGDLWTGITSTVNNIKDTVTNKFEQIKSAIMGPIETAKTFVGDMIDKIRGFFNFSWAFPSLKMPHFYARGSWNPIDWLSQGVPSIGVEWYAKGGIMNDPTAFGMNGNNMMVGGEKDPEAILPLNQKNLSGIGQGIVESSNFGMFEGIVTRLDTLIEIVKALLSLEPKYQILLDTGVLAGELTPYVNKELAKEEKRRGRGSSR